MFPKYQCTDTVCQLVCAVTVGLFIDFQYPVLTQIFWRLNTDYSKEAFPRWGRSLSLVLVWLPQIIAFWCLVLVSSWWNHLRDSWARRSPVYWIYSANCLNSVCTISCKTAEAFQICVQILWKYLMCQHNCGFFGIKAFFTQQCTHSLSLVFRDKFMM